MAERFEEYREIGVAEPLRQGDVLEAVDPAASEWLRHLLVITADCDLAHAKHQGRVTCVPLLSADKYLLEMQVPRIRERYAKRHVKALRRALSSTVAANVSDERLREWPCEAEADEIIAQLGVEDGGVKDLKAALESVRLIGQVAATLTEAVELLVASDLAAVDPPKRDKVVQQVTAELKGAYSRPPGDALFLSAIGPGRDLGYFVYLRHLEQVWEPEIALGPTRSVVTHRRMSRLRDRYTLAIVQRFALVFMSIGLPGEYEEVRDLHAEMLGEAYR